MSNLKAVDRAYLERLLGMSSGYVLSFSNATFEDFIRGSTGEEIYSDVYSGSGDSKANRLRAFWDAAPDDKVAALLTDLLTVMVDNEKIASDGPEADRMNRIINELGKSPGPSIRQRPASSNAHERRAFVSYSVERKEAGGAVKTCLSQFGYMSFLAHEDLHVSEEWKERILQELGTADVFVALLSKEFVASKWCSQELGYIVSRPDVLVVPLSLDGTMPYGFIEHLQGITVHRGNLATILQDVLYRKRPRHIIPVQIEYVRSAGSFRAAEAAVRPLVPHFAQFSNDEVENFARAVASNSEVWNAGLCATEYIPQFVKVNGSRLAQEAADELLSVLPSLKFPRPGSRPVARRASRGRDNQAQEGMLPVVTFPNQDAWNGDTETVSFPAEASGKRIPCRVSWEALQDHFGARDVPPLGSFRSNRTAIEAIASRLIERGRLEPDGSILIRSRDI